MKITQEQIKALTEMKKYNKGNIKPEYDLCYFLPDGFMYYANFQHIIRIPVGYVGEVARIDCEILLEAFSKSKGGDFSLEIAEEEVFLRHRNRLYGQKKPEKFIKRIDKLFIDITAFENFYKDTDGARPHRVIRDTPLMLLQFSADFIYKHLPVILKAFWKEENYPMVLENEELSILVVGLSENKER